MTVMALAPEQLDELADKVAERLLRAQSGATPAAAQVRLGPLTCEEFAAAIRRRPRHVNDLCRLGMIRTLPGVPYRILPEELARYRAEGPLTGSAAKPLRRKRRAA